MHKYFIVAILSIITTTAIAQAYDPETAFQVKTLGNANINQVEAKTMGGNISLQATDNSDARLEIYIWPGNNRNKLTKEEIQKRLDEDYDLSFEVNGNKLSAISKQKKGFHNWKRSLSISYRIYLPKNASGNLRTSGGNISITGMSGATQDFSTSGGNLSVESVTGKIIGRTSGGNITIKNASDDINVSTSGGNISAENSKGNIHISTSGGNLSLSNLDGTIDASTSGGSVDAERIAGALSAKTSGGNLRLTELTCSLDASTSGGAVDVSIKTLGKYLTLRNSGGNIALKLPGNAGMDIKLRGDKVKINEMKNFNGSTEEHRIEGQLNGGGIPVNVDDGSGDVTVTLE